MTEHRRRFPPGPTHTGPWGESHLALDAVVAFVDEELSPGARARALNHLAGCGDCASEVVAQAQARQALREAAAPAVPSSLFHALRDIPISASLPDPPAGLAVGRDGEIVSMLRPDPGPRRPVDRRSRLGAGAVVSGLALGALFITGGAELVPDADALVGTAEPGVAAPGGRIGATMRLGDLPAGVPGGAVPGRSAEPEPTLYSGSLRIGRGSGSVPAVAVVPAISLPR